MASLALVMFLILLYAVLSVSGRYNKAKEIESRFPEIPANDNPWREFLRYETMKRNTIVQGNRLDNGDLKISIEGKKDRLISLEEIFKAYWDKRA